MFRVSQKLNNIILNFVCTYICSPCYELIYHTFPKACQNTHLAGELDTLFPVSAALTGTGTGKKLAQSKR